MKDILFFDTEIDPQSGNLLDIGAIKSGGAQFHDKSQAKFAEFAKGHRYFCGHNIVAHDLKYRKQNVRPRQHRTNR